MEAVSVARQMVNVARYVFLSEHCKLPHTVNCFLLVWWVYRQCGVEVPRTFVEQLYCGTPVELAHALPGDVMFTTAHRWNHHDGDRAKGGVGHSGILTGHGTVIHASWHDNRVVEVPLSEFLSRRALRGVYRLTRRDTAAFHLKEVL